MLRFRYHHEEMSEISVGRRRDGGCVVICCCCSTGSGHVHKEVGGRRGGEGGGGGLSLSYQRRDVLISTVFGPTDITCM